MEHFIPKRFFWPDGPLRVLFSILAVLSAVCLYFVTPRFAESPSLFASAALILFVAEVIAFEVGIRHLSLSAMKLEVIRLTKQFELFADLTPAELEMIVGAAREKRYSCGERIFIEGDPVDHVTMLLSGFVKVTQMGLLGNEVILRLNGAGEIVGSYRVCTDCTHASAAQAVQPSRALVWDAAVFEKLQIRIPTFRRNSIRALKKRLLEMEQRFREVSTETVGSRLSSELIRISDRLRRSTDGRLEIPVSRAELGQMIGTTPFTVNQLLAMWEAQGILTQDNESFVREYISTLNEVAVNP
jgi:CRP-like cAMP-binding protein